MKLSSHALSPAFAFLLASGGAAGATQVSVKDPWVRATVPAQKSTGAFMQLTSTEDARLVEAHSPAAGTVEIHEMSMTGNVMKMHEVPGGVPLPAGKPVTLGPGGYHVMMMDLKGQVKAGDSVPLTLVIEDKNKQRQTIEVKAIAQPLGGGAPMSGMKMH